MSTKLYHRDIYLPEGMVNAWTFKVWKLDYTKHALQAALTDRYGLPKRLPKTIQFTQAHVFEVQTSYSIMGWHTSKVCIRVNRLDCCFEGPWPDMDLCLVLTVGDRDDTLTVKTLWFNHRNDQHATLDASKYTQQP